MKTISCLSLIVILFVSCKKENDKDWLVADIYAADAITGEPVMDCKAMLCYVQYTSLGSYYENPVDLGMTDENGYLHVEWRLPRKADKLKITVLAPGKYADPYGSLNYECSSGTAGTEVETGEKKVLINWLYPYGWYRFHCKNQNCFDQTDSMRIHVLMTDGPGPTESYTQVIYGCADTIVPYSLFPGYGIVFTKNPHLLIDKHIYRNGWDTIIYQTVDLNMDGAIQEIEIVY